ncbi:MAG TPA: hypothetical protein VFE44_01875 [Thermoanaerobaculia bacterium]|nr:hypothetical protein [Thermoanaerobaculia bacterium]
MAPRQGISEQTVALALAGALVFLQLLGIWLAPVVPTQDGPVHLEIAAALRELWRGQPGLLAEYYAINPTPEPNLLSYLVLDGLAVVAGWRTAEKILLSACVALLAAAVLYCLRAVRRDAAYLLVLALPLGVSFFFHMGFHNFCLSLPLGLLTLGHWLRQAAAEPRWPATLGLATGLFLTTLAHAVAGAVTLLAVAVLAAHRALQDSRRLPAAARLRALARRLARPLVAGLPAAALLLVFLADKPRQPSEWLTPATLLKRLVLLQSLTSYDRREHLAAAAYGLLLAGLVVAKLARRRTPDERRSVGGLWVVAAVLLVLYFALPSGLAGGGYLNLRLQLFVLFMIVLWLADGESSAGQRRAALAGGCAVAVALLVLHLSAYRRLGLLLEEYASVSGRVPPESVVLPISLINDEDDVTDPSLVAYKVRPYLHAIGYAACERRLVDLTNYQADQGYFPLIYQPGRNPYRHLVPDGLAVEDSPQRIDLAGYARQGGRVDAVLLWGRRVSTHAAEADPLLRQLSGDYELAFTSEPRGLGELYLRRPGPGSTR